MIGTTRQRSKLDLPSKIIAPNGDSFSSNALTNAESGCFADQAGYRCIPWKK
jgi:hypothetical protein